MWEVEDNNKKQSFVVEQILTAINLIIVFRLLFLSIDIDFFRDELSGKLNIFGQYIKIFQAFFEGITEPIIAPFKGIMYMFLNVADKEIINILAPILTIVSLMVINLIIKISIPYINEYIRKKNDI